MSEDLKNVDDMKELFESSSTIQNIGEHEIVNGTVVSVNHDEAFVDIGYKQEIAIPKRELAFPEPESAEDVVNRGDRIKVYIQSLGGETGGVLSKVKADNEIVWNELRAIKNYNDSPNIEKLRTVEAKVVQVNKGGLKVNVRSLNGFIPASHIAIQPVKNLEQYIGQTLKAVPIEVKMREKKLVLSRKLILEEKYKLKQQEIIKSLHEGEKVKGIVKRLVEYGAFIDIGGYDGLAHISDLSWEHVVHPSDVLEVGQEVEVYIKSIDPKAGRVSLSLKDNSQDPWLKRVEKYIKGAIIEGKIVKIVSFGAFMEIEPGFDGLIPISELSDQDIDNVEDVVHVGDIVKTKVLRVDVKRKKISLSMNRAKYDTSSSKSRYHPFESFNE